MGVDGVEKGTAMVASGDPIDVSAGDLVVAQANGRPLAQATSVRVFQCRSNHGLRVRLRLMVLASAPLAMEAVPAAAPVRCWPRLPRLWPRSVRMAVQPVDDPPQGCPCEVLLGGGRLSSVSVLPAKRNYGPIDIEEQEWLLGMLVMSCSS